MNYKALKSCRVLKIDPRLLKVKRKKVDKGTDKIELMFRVLRINF